MVGMFAPVVTIGGGTVLDIAAHRRGPIERLRVLESAPLADRIGLLVSESRYGMGMPELVSRTGLLESVIKKAVANSPSIVLQSPHFWVLDSQWVARVLETMHGHLKQFHRQNPLLAGVSKEELRSKYLAGPPPWLMDSLLARAKTLTLQGETLQLASNKSSLTQDQTDATRTIE